VIVDQCLNVSLQELSRDTHPNPPERDARCRERLTKSVLSMGRSPVDNTQLH
jgi:hypothetical protein